MRENRLSGSVRGWGTTDVWSRYCGTTGKPGGNRENKHRPAASGVPSLLDKKHRTSLSFSPWPARTGPTTGFFPNGRFPNPLKLNVVSPKLPDEESVGRGQGQNSVAKTILFATIFQLQ